MLRVWHRVGLLAAVIPFASKGELFPKPLPIASKCRAGRQSISNGAELVTVFCQAGGTEMPVVSVLRDTLGDPHADTARLRRVWIFSYARPTLLQRAEALLPVFFRARAGAKEGAAPRPVTAVDLSVPQHQTWARLAEIATQSEFLDVRGAFVRAPTRSYRSHCGDYKDMKIAEALAAIEEAGVVTNSTESADAALSSAEWQELETRLALAARLLGGLVSNSGLSSAWARIAVQEKEHRGHNWELLRQRAEANGLYFEPLAFGGSAPAEAVLWAAQTDLDSANSTRLFDKSFLGIKNPWNDPRLKNWSGYEETWYLDEQGRRVGKDDPGSRPVTMIPLAVYSLTYPRSPLLLVDFRGNVHAQYREVAGRVADYVALGVFGLTGFANWEYTAGHAAWQWYRDRHGAAVARALRLNAYAELRLALLMGSGLDPKLRDTIAKQVDAMPLSPFEQPISSEAKMAQNQYEALLQYAKTPGGLDEQLMKDRGRELVALEHGRGARAIFLTGTVLTAGVYHHREQATPERLSSLIVERRTRSILSALQGITRSGPRIDVAWDRAVVNSYLDALVELSGENSRFDKEISSTLEQVFAKTDDQETRLRCLSCLSLMHGPAGRATASRLLERQDAGPILRAAAMDLDGRLAFDNPNPSLVPDGEIRSEPTAGK